ncbi:MAG: EF2563 family selenium-dependent molybdenum hydroxylase system protein [Acidobacteria bacterium]|nr:EF2563 family selenium-dependent molybdenum hydroxylase system protein [Acidobacteriota bacterium]MBI3657748.1 EF2563 family selenium-dependent molybdenum hydroxylase system protein [Acidobacteriota bacterium]
MKHLYELKVLLRGGGEMASAVALALWHGHIRYICVTEIDQPTAIRRGVCFSEAVYDREKTVEGVRAERVEDLRAVQLCWENDLLPVLVDPQARIRKELAPDVLIDGTLRKRVIDTALSDAPCVIALGPGFWAGRDAHVVIETNRGHHLGRLIERGEAEPDTGMPGAILGVTEARVLRSPSDGVFITDRNLRDFVQPGDRIGAVNDASVVSPIAGVLRGLIRPGSCVTTHMKIGDVDPRGDPLYCDTVSDKARTIAGGVLQALLMRFNR